jgi:SAM-dependent methyltransferase
MDTYYKWKIARLRKQNAAKSRREVFTDVYTNNVWGGARGEYCSGGGSSEGHGESYSVAVRRFIEARKVSIVVDLGCGDFQVGKRLQIAGVRYIGVDIVEELIKRNNDLFGTEHTTFLCRDVVVDELPDGDLCLVRQVLQHLSNGEIIAVLAKLAKYQYALVTEHYPSPLVEAIPNLDKPHGGDTRILDNSAVYLDKQPFALTEVSEFLVVDAGHYLVVPGETIRTFLISH